VNIFFAPFITSFLLAVALLAGFIFLGRKINLTDSRNSKRHIHSAQISRLGGIAIIISFILALLIDKRLVIETPLLAVIFVSGAILIFGLVDDFRELSWKAQLFFQIMIVILLYCAGIRLEYISNPLGGIILFDGTFWQLVGFLLASVWVIFVVNVLNWTDGIDGASGGISIICALTIFFLSLKPEVNQPPVGIITAALVGSLLAFLLFNFHPAKIMAGTSGSMFMGFILAALAIFAGAKIATTLLVLAIPALDALWVIFERIRFGKFIFHADRRHLHFRLLELGWSQRKICILYYGVTLLIALIALNTRISGKVLTFLIFLAIMAVFLAVINKKINTQKETPKTEF
jgi:UDP-GlcNAc:undecaprenyl-phosphate GlcNAc-1-phosphate transferase